MQIAEKIIKHMVLVAVLVVVIASISVGVTAYYNAKHALKQATKDRFVALRKIKADQVRKYFDTIRQQVIIYSNTFTAVEATKKFTAAFNNYQAEEINKNKNRYKPMMIKHYLGEFATRYTSLNGGKKIDAKALIDVLDETSFDLQYYYILNNPYDLEEKSKLDYAEDNTEYSKVHKKFHRFFREYKEKFGLYDLFLVDSSSGRIVYSVMKELDFTTSLKSGPYMDSGIGKVFHLANASEDPDFAVLEDFAPYIPSYNEQSAFISSPIFDGDQKVGVMVFQLATTGINNIMTNDGKWQEVGLGKTGESYIVGQDFLMRSMSRFFIEDPAGYLASMKSLGVDQVTLDSMRSHHTNIGLQPIHTDVSKAVISGEEGFLEYLDYRGIPCLTAFEPLNIRDLNWGIIFGIDADEALAQVYTLGWKIAWYTVVIVFLASFLSVIIAKKLAKQISSPIEGLCNAVNIIADSQDLTKRVNGNEIYELANIAKAINGLVASFQKTCIETVESTMEMQTAAGRLKQMASDIKPSSGYKIKHEYDPEFADGNAAALKQSGENLEELSAKLQQLSKQFKLFEAEADKSSGW